MNSHIEANISLSDLADEILAKPASARETLYCNIVDFYNMDRGEQWDLMLELAQRGWER